jgi:hypothetical protein
VDISAPRVGEGVGVAGTRAIRQPNNRTHKDPNSRGAITTIGVVAPDECALGHMCAKGAGKPTPCHPAPKNRQNIEGVTALMVNDTGLCKPVPAKVHGNNKQVETELSCPQIEDKTGLGTPALQQRVRSPQAPSGRRALHTPHTGATQPGGSALQQHPSSPAPSGRRAERAPPTQPCTTTVFSPEQKLANSPIIVANLGKKLEDYVKINKAHATDLWNGFSYGFKLGYMGPR